MNIDQASNVKIVNIYPYSRSPIKNFFYYVISQVFRASDCQCNRLGFKPCIHRHGRV